ncbi:MAG: toxin-antitoxin system HicB family antitoxin [Xanthomonadales bacterium]|nr:toxin-antitoxin system HicB family antitoxin [Xanthomonadales bacterium]
MFDPHAYGIEVRRCVIDDETVFQARVRELPDVAEYADSWTEAYDLAVDTIATTAALLEEAGRPMPPVAKPADDWSGRVTLRLPRSLHRALTDAAESEGNSLNQYMVNVLSFFSGYAQAKPFAKAHWVVAERPVQPSASGHLRLVHSQDYTGDHADQTNLAAVL